MELKLKQKDFIYYYLLFICIVNLQFLMFADFTNIFNVFTAGSSVLLAFVCWYAKPINKRIKPYTKFINAFIFLFFSYYFIETLYGLVFSDIGILEYAKRLLPFLYILLVYPFVYLISDKNYREKLLNSIVILSVISLIMKTIVWWSFNYREIDLMHYVLFEENNVWQRNGLIRIRSSSFDALVISLSLRNYFFNRKNKLLSVLIIAFLLWYANYVMQSRALLVSIAATIFFTLTFRKTVGWKKCVTIIFLTIVAVVILQSRSFNEFVNSFDLSTYSTNIRLQGFKFYINKVKNHVLLGLIPLNTYESIKEGNWRYYISDLGMISKFFEYGIIGFIIFNIPFIRNMYLNIRKFKGKNIISLSMGGFILLCSYLSNDVYITKFILALPILIAWTEVAYKENLQDKNIKIRR